MSSRDAYTVLDARPLTTVRDRCLAAFSKMQTASLRALRERVKSEPSWVDDMNGRPHHAKARVCWYRWLMGTELEDEERAARRRLADLGPHLPVGDLDRAKFLPSHSNDVWCLDDLVLRVCWRRDRRRSTREVLIGQVLPSSLRHPSVVSSGEHGGLAWQLQRYVPGKALSTVWLDMPPSDLRPIATQLARMLKTLHAWRPPGDVVEALAEREGSQTEFGVNLVPLPLAHAMDLLAPAARQQWVDPALIREVERRLVLLSEFDAFDSDERRVVVHDVLPARRVVVFLRLGLLLEVVLLRVLEVVPDVAH